jgi:glutathione S-transferase
MYTLYSMQRSGNCYKVRLALAKLRIPYELVEIDILKGESRTPEFLAKNPSGHVPLLEVEPNRYLPESNAILWYLAGGTPLAPDDKIHRAEALRWMFFEQHSLEPNLGAAWFWLTLVKGGRDLQVHALEDWMEQGYRDGESRAAISVLCRGPLHDRRHCALWLHPHCPRDRFRPDWLSCGPRLAQAHRRAARPRPHGVAAGPDGDRRLKPAGGPLARLKG